MTVTKTETLPVRSGDDVVRVRQRVRALAVEIGLGLVDQTKIITAASELAGTPLTMAAAATSSWRSSRPGCERAYV